MSKNFIVANVYSIKRIESSDFGNPRWELNTSYGKLKTQVDGQIGYSLGNFERVIREEQPKVELTGGPHSVYDIRILTGDLLDDIASGVRR